MDKAVLVKLRMGLILLMGLGLCGALGAEIWWWGGGILHLPIPIGGVAGLPVPALYWASVLGYTGVYGRIFQLPLREQASRAIRLGFALHLLVLLADLAWYLAANTTVGSSPWYRSYAYVIWGTALAGGVVAGGRGLTRWWYAWTADPWLFYLPLLGGYLVLGASTRVVPSAVTCGAVLASLGLLAGERSRLLRTWGNWGRELVRSERGFLLLVCGLALALRLFYTTRVMSNPDYLNTGSDGSAYDALAWALIHGGETHWSHIQLFAPGYVRFLALVYWLVGRNYFLVCAVQSVIGALACVLMYAIAKRLFGQLAARVAAVFGAVNFPMVFSAAAIGHQALDLFWTLAVVWCLVCYVQDPQRWGRWIVGIGLLLGWAAATREGNLAFWVVLIGWFLLGVRAKLGWWTALLHAAGLSLGVVVMLLPFMLGGPGALRGRLAYHWFINAPGNINGWFNPWRDSAAAWTLLQEQPLEVVSRLTQGLMDDFNVIFLSQGYGAFDPVFLFRWTTYFYGMWWYAYTLAFVGFGMIIWQAIRAPVQRLGWWVIILVLISRSLVHLFLEAGYRHRVPIEPYLIMVAAYSLVCLMRVGRKSIVSPNI